MVKSPQVCGAGHLRGLQAPSKSLKRDFTLISRELIPAARVLRLLERYCLYVRLVNRSVHNSPEFVASADERPQSRLLSPEKASCSRTPRVDSMKGAGRETLRAASPLSRGHDAVHSHVS